MSNIKDFKAIADEMMKEVTVSERLKAQTLQRCANKRIAVRSLLAPAAAFAAVFVCAVVLTALLQGGGSEPPGVLSATDSPSPLMTGQQMEFTPEEAADFFGESFMMPDRAPQGFSLQHISLTGEDAYKQAALTFSDGERSYVVIEEKHYAQGSFEAYEEVNVGGIKGYIRYADSEVLPDAEVHWTDGDVHYAVIGSVTKEEALEIARSMKIY